MTGYLSRMLTAGVVCLLVLALAAPALVGLYLAREHQRLIDGLTLPGAAQMTVVDFERGWFNSRLRLRVTPGACPDGDCRGAILNSVIHHGPVPLTAPNADGEALVRGIVETRLDLATLFGDLRVQPAPPTLTVVSRLPLAGGVVSQVSLPETELRLAGGEGAARLAAGPLSAELRVPPAGEPVIDVAWPRFSLVAERGGQIAFRELNAGFTGGPGGWRDYQFAVESAQYATAGGRGAALDGLRLDATAADGGGSDFALRLSRLSARGNEYGPALLNGRLRLASGGAAPPLPVLVQAVAAAAAPVDSLLRTRPRLRLDRILLGTPSGDVRGELNLRVNADAAPGGALPPALRGRAELLVPVSMMENVTAAIMRHRHPDQPPPTPRRVEKAIAGWQQSGFITYRETDNAYVINAELTGRDLIVNQRELADWPDLLGRIQQDDGLERGEGLGPGARGQ